MDTVTERRSKLASATDALLRATGIIVAAGLLMFLSNNRNWTALFVPSGQISAGSKYGIAIGDNKADVLRKLRADGFQSITVSRAGSMMGRKLRGDEFIYAYEFNWRAGYVCVSLQRGVAREIAWHYNMLDI